MKPETLKELIEDAEFETRSYSGRGMYGKECLGVVLEAGDEIAFGAKVVLAAVERNDDLEEDDEDRVDLDDLVGDIESASTDSLGRGTILYFPRIEFTE